MRRISILAALLAVTATHAQELWHLGKPADTYGIYFMMPTNLQTQGGRGVEQIQDGRRVVFNAPNMNINSKQETLVGRVDAKVSDTVLGEYACKLYSSTYTVQGRTGTVLRNVLRRNETWVDFKGVTRKVKTYYRDDRKVVEIEAVFGKDEIEMDISENGKKRHLTMNPIEGLEAFNNPIPEMLKNADKDRYEKTWCTIDATNGGILKYTIRLKGRFVPPSASSSKVKGFSFEVKAPVGIHTMYVSEDGQMREIEYADTSVVRATNSVRTLGGG